MPAHIRYRGSTSSKPTGSVSASGYATKGRSRAPNAAEAEQCSHSGKAVCCSHGQSLSSAQWQSSVLLTRPD
eukprot:652917-Pleurochrysis_carterae.AAC.2